MKEETEAREMNLLYLPFPFPALLIWSGRAEAASRLPKFLLPFFAYMAGLYFPDTFAFW